MPMGSRRLGWVVGSSLRVEAYLGYVHVTWWWCHTAWALFWLPLARVSSVCGLGT